MRKFGSSGVKLVPLEAVDLSNSQMVGLVEMAVSYNQGLLERKLLMGTTLYGQSELTKAQGTVMLAAIFPARYFLGTNSPLF